MTKQTNDGGPAFPCESYGLKNGRETTVPAQGMTLRDYFAAAALQGIMAGHYTSKAKEWAPKCAYNLADAMLAQREVKP
jgi:hypothetical protein